MYAYHIETSVSKDGSLNLKKLLFKPGKQIEVIMLERESKPKNNDYFAW